MKAMPWAVLAAALQVAATTLHARESDSDLWWNAANAFGFIACGLITMVALVGGRAPPAGPGVAFHRHFGWAALAAVSVHGLMMLRDPAVIEYLVIGAPAYMWAGLAALALLVLLATSGGRRVRRRWFRGAKDLRSAHLIWSASAGALVCWHVSGSGSYLRGTAASALFVAGFLGVPVVAWWRGIDAPGATRLRRRWPYAASAAFFLAFLATRAKF